MFNRKPHTPFTRILSKPLKPTFNQIILEEHAKSTEEKKKF